MRGPARPGLAAVGRAIGARPTTSLAGLALVLAIAALGLFNARVVTEPAELWSPRGSSLRAEANDFDDAFGPFYRTNSVAFVDTSGERNLLAPAKLRVILKLQRLVESATATHKGKTYRYSDLCLNPTRGKCVVASPLDYWSPDNGPFNSTELNVDANNCDSSEKAYDAAGFCNKDYGYTVSLPHLKTALGAGIVRKNVLGGVTSRPSPYSKLELFDDAVVATAEAALITFLLEWRRGSESEDAALAWERNAFKSTVDAYIASGEPAASGLRVTYLSERGLEDELAASSAADAPLVVASYAVVIVYAAAAVLRGGAAAPGATAARAGVGAAGAALVALATLASVGFLALIGVPFVPITAQVLPFLALAIGVNDLFVIVNAGFDSAEAQKAESIAERSAVAAATAGPSVLCTSLCNATAFLVGTASELPAARLFCIHAATTVLATGAATLIGALALAAMSEQVHERAISDRRNGNAAFEHVSSPPLTQRLLARYFPPVERPGIREAVIALALGATVAAIHAITEFRLGLDPEDVVPRGSQLAGYYSDLREFFPDVGPPLFIVTQSPIDAASIEGQRTVEALHDALVASPWNGAPPIDWLGDFTLWFALEFGPLSMLYDEVSEKYRVPPANFTSALGEYLKTPCGKNAQGGQEVCGLAKSLDLKLAPDGRVEVSRLTSQYVGLGRDVRYWTRGMEDLRTLAETHGGRGSFAYSSYFIFFEQYLTVRRDALVLTCAALAAVAAVVFLARFAMVAPGSQSLAAALRLATIDAFAVALAVSTATVLAVGTMAAAGIRLNAVSAVNASVAVGLSIDFVAHTIFDFRDAQAGDPATRARQALGRLGSCTMSGALSTLLGICFLVAAATPLYRVYYFRAYASIVIAGTFVGLAVLPAGLSLFGALAECASGRTTVHEPATPGTKAAPRPPPSDVETPSSIRPGVLTDVFDRELN